MKRKIAVLPGDGVGREVIKEAVKVLEAIAETFGHEFTFREGLVGANAIEHTGDSFPEESERICKTSDAILFGAIGDPRNEGDLSAKFRPEQGLLKMRSSLGLFANVRPIRSYPELYSKSPLKNSRIQGVDFVVYRELASGIYHGSPKGRSDDGQEAFDTCHYTRDEILKISKMAFDVARSRRRKLTLVDKATVLSTSRLWREQVTELGKQYSDVELEFMFVDNAAVKIITQPAHFDVILTDNMFGDILTDEASVIAGSLGMLPSASIGPYNMLFEPIHGSYPDVAGKNVANPLAAVLSTALLLDMAFNANKEAQLVREAVDYALKKGVVTADIDPVSNYGTSAVGEFISDYIHTRHVSDNSSMTII